MTVAQTSDTRTGTTRSGDGTTIAYHSVGHGPGLVVVGGVLSSGADYLALARALASQYEVHVMERRGRPGSGPQRPDHRLEDECDDLLAVMAATDSRVVFGHSFGGLVALETARRRPALDRVVVYEPGVPIRGRLRTDWLDDYQRRLEEGDRRGAFARMVKSAGFAPAALTVMPVWYVRIVLGLVIRGEKWAAMDRLLEANLVEHRVQAVVDAPDAERFSAITARTTLLGGSKSPDSISGRLLEELAAAIPHSTVAVLRGLGHLAPEDQPERLAAAILGGGTTLRSREA